MEPKILTTNDRGQLTLPKDMRDEVGARVFICSLEDGGFVLKPMQTREEFWDECDAAFEDWKKHGGYTLEEMKKRHNL
ncbi:AbrB/MazE/SpoVT family DNA-binding domain-containing protein [Patescibacteria group bacterium]|nr:AbrB/MazE/SpoVT family DNA-binding domain-containing protein [Patescibacteria group bacterium]MBU1123713.1 AbrB/MazE/SpoVT family DNA-binding domain-containing protein [Patescibacteria group bacterium]